MRPRVSNARMTMSGHEILPRCRQRHPFVGRLDIDRHGGVRRCQLSDDPAPWGQRSDERLGLSDRTDLEWVGEEEAVDIEGARRSRDGGAADDTDALDGHRLRAGIPQLVQEVPDRDGIDRAGHRDRHAIPRYGIQTGPGADPREVRLDLLDRRSAGGVVRPQLGELLLEPGDLDAQPIVLGVQRADEVRQVLRGLALERGATGLVPELDDDEQPQEERYDGDRQLASAVTHPERHRPRPSSRRHWTLPAGEVAGVAAAGGPALGVGTARDWSSVTEPAKAGMSTIGGSARESSMPNEPILVTTNSWKPGKAEARAKRSVGPIALTSYGPAT